MKMIDTIADLKAAIESADDLRSQIVFGELIQELSDNGEYNHKSLALAKAATAFESAEMYLREALLRIEESK